MQGFPPTSQETQGDERNEFQGAHRLRDFYAENAEVIWLFHWLPRGLPSYLDLSSCVEGTRKSRKEVNKLDIWGLAEALC